MVMVLIWLIKKGIYGKSWVKNLGIFLYRLCIVYSLELLKDMVLIVLMVMRFFGVIYRLYIIYFGYGKDEICWWNTLNLILELFLDMMGILIKCY